ncbi:class I SAM-dependent methyltransferase [Myxococcota bacterium]|nr:class I SAM-dependent methyltransferase [Myxococcota bacterium]
MGNERSSDMGLKKNELHHYTEANRRAWDQSAPVHRSRERFRELLDGFSQPGYSCLKQVEVERLLAIGVEQKDVAQVCCNNGRELLSIKNLGAGRCVGFDQAPGFIAQARELATAGELSCEFVKTNAYEISHEFDQAFDLVVITIGVFGWMPDLLGFFDVLTRLIRPGGHLFIHEQHPITNMLETRATDPFALAYSYFKPDPFVEEDVIVYDSQTAGQGETHYWFVHTLGDLLTACLEHELELVHFAESPENISSEEFDIYAGQEAQLPLSYTLTAKRSPSAMTSHGPHR